MTKKNAISTEAVAELHKKSGLPEKVCRAALKPHGVNVDQALVALIDAGRVHTSQLNPETVSDELFERAARRQKLENYRTMLGGADKLPNGKTIEQLMAEDDARRKEGFERLKKIVPGMANAISLTPGQAARQSALADRRSARLKANPFTLKLPPLPPLKLEMHEWVGADVLTAWAGTQKRLDPYTSRSSRASSKGAVTVQIPRLCEDDANPLPPAPEQMKAYAHLKTNQAEITNEVLKALLAYYKKTRAGWLKNDPHLKLPVIQTIEEMRKKVGLGTLHVHKIAKGGYAYIGLELGCTWDEEHGAGVLLRKDAVVQVGQADASFDEHAAKKDGGTEFGVAQHTR